MATEVATVKQTRNDFYFYRHWPEVRVRFPFFRERTSDRPDAVIVTKTFPPAMDTIKDEVLGRNRSLARPGLLDAAPVADEHGSALDSSVPTHDSFTPIEHPRLDVAFVRETIRGRSTDNGHSGWSIVPPTRGTPISWLSCCWLTDLARRLNSRL